MPGKTGIVTGGSQICGSPFCIPRLWESRMSQNRKLLKVFSLIQVLVAVFALVLGFVTIGSSEAAAGTTVDVFGMQLEGGMWTLLCGGLSIATGVLPLSGRAGHPRSQPPQLFGRAMPRSAFLPRSAASHPLFWRSLAACLPGSLRRPQPFWRFSPPFSMAAFARSSIANAAERPGCHRN